MTGGLVCGDPVGSVYDGWRGLFTVGLACEWWPGLLQCDQSMTGLLQAGRFMTGDRAGFAYKSDCRVPPLPPTLLCVFLVHSFSMLLTLNCVPGFGRTPLSELPCRLYNHIIMHGISLNIIW